MINLAPNQLKDLKKQENTPILIDGLSDIVSIASGACFNLVLHLITLNICGQYL